MADICFEHGEPDCELCNAPVAVGEIVANDLTLSLHQRGDMELVPATVTLDPNLETAWRMMVVRAEEALTFIDNLAPSATLDEIAEYTRSVAAARRRWDEERKRYLEPLTVQRDVINAGFKSALDLLVDAEGKLKVRVQELQAAERRRAEAEAAEKNAELANLREQLMADGEEEAVAALPTTIPVAAAKPKGISTRLVWSAQVTDIKLLCAAVADGSQPSRYVEANMAALNQAVKAAKDETKIPGVVAQSRDSTSAR